MRSNRVGPTFAQVAQLGERQTEDLNVPGSSPGLGMFLPVNNACRKRFLAQIITVICSHHISSRTATSSLPWPLPGLVLDPGLHI